MLALVAVLAMGMFASCGGASTASTNDTDSVTIVADSTATDSINVDTLTVDSAAFTCDSLCSCTY